MDNPKPPGASAAPLPEEKNPLTPARPASQTQPESPLATQLPPWDLLPAHTLLVRRRPLKN